VNPLNRKFINLRIQSSLTLIATESSLHIHENIYYMYIYRAHLQYYRVIMYIIKHYFYKHYWLSLWTKNKLRSISLCD